MRPADVAVPPEVSPRSMLCLALYQAQLAFNRLYRSVLAELGLTYPQYLVMLMLLAEDGLAMKAVGERLMLDSGTLTPLLKRLEQSGLITRRRNPADERQVSLHLTEQGRALAAGAACVPERVEAALGPEAPAAARLTGDLVALRDRLLAAA